MLSIVNYTIAVIVLKFDLWILTGGFLFLRNFSVAISLSPNICLILLLIFVFFLCFKDNALLS